MAHDHLAFIGAVRAQAGDHLPFAKPGIVINDGGRLPDDLLGAVAI
jgi:hypothetical protein